MYRFIVRRLLWMIPSFFAVSLVSFIIMRLPPGDFVTSYAADLATSGAPADQGTLDNLRHHYGLDRPLYMQYVTWIWNALQGDLGVSFEYRAPVVDIIWSRLGMTFLVATCTLLFVWIVAFPIGIYSATHQYSWEDYGLSLLGFLGIAIPNFIKAREASQKNACIANLKQIDGAKNTWALEQKKVNADVPADADLLANVEPVYEEVDGFSDIAQCRRFDDLPPAARAYVARIEEYVGVPVRIISVGPRRDQTLVK